MGTSLSEAVYAYISFGSSGPRMPPKIPKLPVQPPCSPIYLACRMNPSQLQAAKGDFRTFPEEWQLLLICQLSVVECHHKKDMGGAEPHPCAGIGGEPGPWPSPTLLHLRVSHHLLFSFCVSAYFTMLSRAPGFGSFARFSETFKNLDPYYTQSQLLRTFTLSML